MPNRRAVVFDLDDTLYPYPAFLRSGFRAVACRLAKDRGLRPSEVLRVLLRALTAGQRGRELQALCSRFDIPISQVASLTDIIRDHTPSLRLSPETANVLRALRASWKVGVLTNGQPAIQRRKVAALGLDGLVDAVLFAPEYGNGTGKPEPSVFCAALDRLNVAAESAVFVGDDVRADIEGAAAIGMKTIHVLSRYAMDQRCGGASCGVHVRRLSVVPEIAEQLVPVRMESHAA